MGVSIEDAERATKIRRRYIEAIETGDFARLPDGPPSRGFIRNYARYLGLDSDQALNDFEAEVGVPIAQVSENVPPPPTRQQAVSRYTQLIKLPQIRWKGELPSDEQSELDQLAESESEERLNSRGIGRMVFRRSTPPNVANSFSLREPKVTNTSDVRPLQTGRSVFNLRSLGGVSGGSQVVEPQRLSPISATGFGWLRMPLMIAMAVGALLVVVAVIGLVVVPALQGGSGRAAAPAATQVISVSILGTEQPGTPIAVPGAGVTNTTAITNPATSASTPQPTTEAQAPATIQPLVGGGVQLILDARERAWVRVKVDGAVVYEGIPLIGPTAPWRGQNTVGIETGNAGAFEIIINNVRIGLAGPHNATLKTTWDATGKASNE
jgi:hypothetical protein